MFGLTPELLDLLQEYFNNHPDIVKVIIYGSRAMNTYHPGSDIDLAIITKSKTDISSKIHHDLDHLSTPYLFDVIDYNYITHLPLREHIDRVGKILFEKS